MRSKGSGVETAANVLGVPQSDADIRQEDDLGLSVKSLKAKVQQKEPEGAQEVPEKELRLLDKSDNKNGVMDLSKKELFKLLGIMEGEVQAREDVISMLSCKQTSAEALESRYGSAAPASALQALHRDSCVSGTKQQQPSVYQKPMAELERLQEKHKDTYRRMLGQLLLAEKCHRRTVHELDTEKRKHVDYMNKSDDFTNLLEQERERLKKLLETEKAYQTKKEKEHSKRLTKVREELVKLKSFALMLVNERQQNLEQMDQQSQRVQELSQQLLQQEQALKEAKDRTRDDGHRLHNLETELKEKSAKLSQQHEEMNTKLANNEANNRQLNAKILGLTNKVDELESQNTTLKKSEEELMEFRELRKGECGNSNLTTELENLRKRVMEMEGKDEEITKTEHQCKELRKRLQEEDCKIKELRLEVEKLQTRMIELEKLETAFSMSKAECAQLHAALDKEKGLSKDLSDEVIALRIRLKELESSELKMEKTELSLKDDLSKLKSLTVALMDERKSLVEKIKSDDKQKEELNKIVELEQGKVMEVTGKLIEESKKLLKLKSEMETKVQTLSSEKGDLSTKLANEMDLNKTLHSKISLLKKRIDGLEAEKLSAKNSVKSDLGRMSDPLKQDNKVKELTFEIDRLKNRLKQLEVVEGDLIKTEDQYDMLEKRFITEQDKANVLSQQVEEMRSQIARNKAIEKGEEESQKEDLRQRCRSEEAKNRELQADVVALKEKIHELMHKEDQLSQIQVDYSVLQQRFLEEEEKAKNMGSEVFHLAKELEIVKRHSRALRPSLNGRRMMDIATTSTGVQTEALSNGGADEDTPAVFIRKSVQEENHIMSNLRQRCLRKPSEKSIERSPSSGSDLKKSWIPWMRKKDNATQETNLEKHMNGVALPTELTMTQKQGQPLHIRVTPDHHNNTATLEISSPTEDAFSSSAPLSPNPSHSQPKSRITIIPTAAPGHRKSGFGCHVSERAKSPVSITTISRAKSSERVRSSSSTSGRPLSPVSITTISTVIPEGSPSPDLQEMTMGRAVFKVTPEKQMVPMPVRKGPSNNSSIITTEDNKIHIHLGNNPKMAARQGASAAENKEMTLSTGTVLRSPRQITTTTTTATRSTQSKVMSSITINPMSSAPSRQAQNTAVQEPQASRTGLTRIPMSKGLKTGKTVLGSLGISSGIRMESQSMKIEVKKSVTSTTLDKGARF
ncbi:unnamed protein product [Knipowitschia caucasica]